MYPVLFSTPWFNIYSYGFMLAVGYSVAVALSMFKANKNGLDSGTIFDLMMMLLIVGVLGSRLLFVLEYSPEKLHLKSFFNVEQGGLTFYGSIISAILFSIGFAKIKKLSFWKIADSIGFSMGPAIAISRIGCFLNGCCYGTSCSPSIGFKFRFAGEGYYHATQLYESLYSLLGFFFICYLFKKRQTFDGQLFLSFISFYAFFRFFIEFIRVENPIFFLGMTLSQVISIIFIFISVIIWKSKVRNQINEDKR